MAQAAPGTAGEGVRARDEALTKAANNMRIMVSRLEELVDAPYDKDVAAAVAARIGVKKLGTDDIETQASTTVRYFQRWCHEYFLTATSRVSLGERIAPAHVTTHYPSPDAGTFLKFFLHKMREDFLKVNRDHVGDLLFRMAAVTWRRTATLPTERDKKQMSAVLYGEGEEGLYRRLAAEKQGAELATRYTDFEDLTKARYWSVLLAPEDIRDFFERLTRKHRAQSVRKRVPNDYFLQEIRPLADGLRITRRFDVPRFTACFREHKQLFTDFLLDPKLEIDYALPLMQGRRLCGVQSKSILKRAGENRERFEQLYELAESRREAETA